MGWFWDKKNSKTSLPGHFFRFPDQSQNNYKNIYLPGGYRESMHTECWSSRRGAATVVATCAPFACVTTNVAPCASTYSSAVIGVGGICATVSTRLSGAADERATVLRTACAQTCEGERSAARQKISRRVRAPAFAGVTTGSGGTRDAPGSTLGALQRPHATCYHLRPLCRSVTPPPEKVVPFIVGLGHRRL